MSVMLSISFAHTSSYPQVIHRDLKAANILTTKNGNIKLSDFGVSLQLNAVHNTINTAEASDATGTPNWSECFRHLSIHPGGLLTECPIPTHKQWHRKSSNWKLPLTPATSGL